ncbi:MAG: hypothetical protein GY724_22270 [Actinomycetia bacterium]|nr:hypothetical protein [Actinomycetes bacterium]MCP4223547.1 hypothetical protein [Actinomycetes bacterium]MCP5030771.1 hypothetical protein [Actinomycetes bacterium]
MAEPGGYRDRLPRNTAAGRKLSNHQPELHESYWRTHELAMEDGALDGDDDPRPTHHH